MQKSKSCVTFAGLLITCALSGCGSADEGDPVQEVNQRFSTFPSEPNHEDITRAALDFLRPDILEAIVVANASTDVQFALVNANHFDDCNFTGGSQIIATNQAEAVRNLDPSLPPTADAAAILAFGRSLHTAQDFYAHSNWVELGGNTLLDRSLSEFPTLTPYATIASSGFVVVQGAKPKHSALTRETDAPYPTDAIVNVKLDKRKAFGLITGTVDYEPGNFCPDQVAMSHDELNKDKSTIPGRTAQHFAAKALATTQSRHEWCRLASLARAAWGEAGTARLATWVADSAIEPDCTTE